MSQHAEGSADKPQQQPQRSVLFSDAPFVTSQKLTIALQNADHALLIGAVHWYLANFEDCRTGDEPDERPWVFGSREDWYAELPYNHPDSIARIFRQLEKSGLIITKAAPGKRGKWYTLDYERIRRLTHGVQSVAEGPRPILARFKAVRSERRRREAAKGRTEPEPPDPTPEDPPAEPTEIQPPAGRCDKAPGHSDAQTLAGARLPDSGGRAHCHSNGDEARASSGRSARPAPTNCRATPGALPQRTNNEFKTGEDRETGEEDTTHHPSAAAHAPPVVYSRPAAAEVGSGKQAPDQREHATPREHSTLAGPTPDQVLVAELLTSQAGFDAADALNIAQQCPATPDHARAAIAKANRKLAAGGIRESYRGFIVTALRRGDPTEPSRAQLAAQQQAERVANAAADAVRAARDREEAHRAKARLDDEVAEARRLVETLPSHGLTVLVELTLARFNDFVRAQVARTGPLRNQVLVLEMAKSIRAGWRPPALTTTAPAGDVAAVAQPTEVLV